MFWLKERNRRRSRRALALRKMTALRIGKYIRFAHFPPKITGKAGLCYGLSGFYLLHKRQKILGTKDFLRLKRDYGLSGLRLKWVSQ